MEELEDIGPKAFDVEKDRPSTYNYREKKHLSPITIIIAITVAVIYLAYMIILFAVPRKRYNDAKNDHVTIRSPHVGITVIHFLFHIFAATFFAILILMISACIQDVDVSECPTVTTFILTIVTGSCIYLLWLLGLIFGIVFTINPGSVVPPNEVNGKIANANNTHMIFYAYGETYKSQSKTSSTSVHDIETQLTRSHYHHSSSRSRRRKYKYTQPYIVKMNLTDFQYDEFNETKYPDIYGLELKANDDFDENIINYSKIGCDVARTVMEAHGYEMTGCNTGTYPSFKGMYYVSKTGHYKGKYSQSARIAAAFFGVGTYFDHTTSAIPYYSLNINRTFEYYDPSNPPSIDGETILTSSPTISEIYDDLFQNKN